MSKAAGVAAVQGVGYDGWTLNEATYVDCPDDCGLQSPETDDLAKLLDWIDGHRCNGWEDYEKNREAGE